MKKLICIFCVLTLTISLLGCSNKTEGTKQKNNVVVENGEPAENLNKTGLPILNEMEEFKIYVPQMSTLNEANNKPIHIQTVKDTNVGIDWLEIPRASWKEKINILFSTGSLPDAFVGVVGVGVKYEQLTPLDKYLTEEYAPNVVAFFNSRPEYWEVLKAPDGHIYSLPTGDETFWNVVDSQLNVSKEWLKAVGKEVPTNIDEFYDVLVAFKEGDPNGNGDTTDEIPFAFKDIWGWGTALENLFGPFGVLESQSHVYIDNGEVHFGAEEEGYFEALKFFNKLYSEGLMDQEALAHSMDQYDAKIDPSIQKVGFYINYGEKQRDVHVPVVLNGKDGEPMFIMNSIAKVEGLSITKACENPAALVRWYDYVNSSEKLIMEWNRGTEGETWEFAEGDNGQIIKQINEPAVYEKYGVKAGKKAQLRNYLAFGGNSPGFMHLDIFRKWKEEGNNMKPILNGQIVDEGWGYLEMPTGFTTEENTSRRALLLADIDTYLNKFVATSIMHGIDETKWEKHLKTLEKLKVEEYKSLIQEFADGK